MKNNRIKQHKKKKKDNLDELYTFFLACEFKPGSDLWSVLDPFAYDVKPAFIYGSLGILNYNPETYAIMDVNDQGSPLVGYIFTITHEDTRLLLDKIKGYNGQEAFNTHFKTLVHAYTDVNEVTSAWAYILSDYVLETYESIEQVDMGIWDGDDEQQLALLEKIEEFDG